MNIIDLFKEICENLCKFFTAICELIDYREKYENYDCFVIYGNDDITYFWPKI